MCEKPKNYRLTKREILGLLAVFCLMVFITITVGRSVKEKSFIQIWVPSDQRNKIEETCQHEKEVRVQYQTGQELVLPCSAITEGQL